MPSFAYVAKGADGRQSKGTLSAPSRQSAMGELRKQNLNVLTLEEKVSIFKNKNLFGPPKPHVSGKDIAVMTRQLSTMISAGIPLLESLEILQEQADDAGFKLALGNISERVRGGSDFSDALGAHAKIFSRIYINMVKAGEAGGQLDTILKRLADYMEANEALKREIKSAMTYPVISLCMILAITIGLMVGIVPKFEEIFLNLGSRDRLPGPTVFLLDLSRFMTEQWYAWVGPLILLPFGFVAYRKTKSGERHTDWLFLHLPIFGPLFHKVAVSRFTRTFATLLQSGVPMLGALEIVASTAGNRIVEDAILFARDHVRKGEPLGEPLGSTKVFPAMVTRMIAIGEKSGALEQLLEKISDFYDSEVKTTVEALTSLIEPLMIGVMGLLVGGIVLAIFLPIIKLQEMMQKK
jgi:type IV pilus assembly protein PilC